MLLVFEWMNECLTTPQLLVFDSTTIVKDFVNKIMLNYIVKGYLVGAVLILFNWMKDIFGLQSTGKYCKWF